MCSRSPSRSARQECEACSAQSRRADTRTRRPDRQRPRGELRGPYPSAPLRIQQDSRSRSPAAVPFGSRMSVTAHTAAICKTHQAEQTASPDRQARHTELFRQRTAQAPHTALCRRQTGPAAQRARRVRVTSTRRRAQVCARMPAALRDRTAEPQGGSKQMLMLILRPARIRPPHVKY